MSSAYVNANMPTLLQDKDHFNVPFTELGSTAGLLLFWSYLFSTLMAPFVGLIYDILGRYWFILPACFVMAITMGLYPSLAPSFLLLTVIRTLHACLITILFSNPLVIDYVKAGSRGLMLSIVCLGLIFGELLMISTYLLTREMSLQLQYWVPALITGAGSVALIWMIREPTIENVVKRQKADLSADDMVKQGESFFIFSEREPHIQETTWEKFKRLTSEAWQECKTQPKLLYCFFCLLSSRLITVLFSVYLQLWIMSFKESGVIESTELADRTYMRITALAVVGLVFFAPLYGLYSDVADPRKVIPISFLIRGLLAACFKFIQDPNTWQGYLLGVSIIIVSAAQFISVEAYFMYRIKKTVRGTLMGFAMFAGSVG